MPFEALVKGGKTLTSTNEKKGVCHTWHVKLTTNALNNDGDAWWTPPAWGDAMLLLLLLVFDRFVHPVLLAGMLVA